MCGNGFSELCYDVVICQISSLLQETTFASFLPPELLPSVLWHLFVDVPFSPFMCVYVETRTHTHTDAFIYISLAYFPEPLCAASNLSSSTCSLCHYGHCTTPGLMEHYSRSSHECRNASTLIKNWYPHAQIGSQLLVSKM